TPPRIVHRASARRDRDAVGKLRRASGSPRRSDEVSLRCQRRHDITRWNWREPATSIDGLAERHVPIAVGVRDKAVKLSGSLAVAAGIAGGASIQIDGESGEGRTVQA